MILGALMYKRTFICEFRFLSDTFLDYFLINFLQIQVVNSFFFFFFLQRSQFTCLKALFVLECDYRQDSSIQVEGRVIGF